MDEEEFQKTLPHLREILKFALENPYSDFYKKKYKGLGIKPENIKTYADFCKIPMLTKDEILALPLRDRYFVPKEEVIRFSISSGTTNNNKPLILPHIKREVIPGGAGGGKHLVDEEALKKLGIDKIFGLAPAQSVLSGIIADKSRTLPLIIPDIHRLDLAAVLAKELEVEAIISPPTILYFFTEKLRKTGFDCKTVKWISIGSELCTSQKFAYFKRMYPNAIFQVRFGNSESGAPLGFRCDYRRDDPPQLFHPADMLRLLEIMPEDDKYDGPGEMVVTHLTKDAFPLIRYKTNDFATRVRFDCECGRKYLIDTSGKSDLDILKTSGIVLHTQAIADAVETVSKFVENDFQMHVYEETLDGKLVTRLVLHLSPQNIGLDEKEIAKYIQKQLQISVDKVLDDIIEEGAFLPLEVQFVPHKERINKSKNIISHLNEN